MCHPSVHAAGLAGAGGSVTLTAGMRAARTLSAWMPAAEPKPTAVSAITATNAVIACRCRTRERTSEGMDVSGSSCSPTSRSRSRKSLMIVLQLDAQARPHRAKATRQQRLHGPGAAPEQLCDAPLGEILEVPKHDGRALSIGQLQQGGSNSLHVHAIGQLIDAGVRFDRHRILVRTLQLQPSVVVPNEVDDRSPQVRGEG